MTSIVWRRGRSANASGRMQTSLLEERSRSSKLDSPSKTPAGSAVSSLSKRYSLSKLDSLSKTPAGSV
eukprot:554441-Hanusia_phi.AAC.2